MKQNVIESVFAKLEALRSYEEAAASERLAALREDKEFERLDNLYISKMFECAKAEAFGSDCEGQKAELIATKKARLARIKQLGRTEEEFLPARHCKLCGDTGVVDGKACKCFNALYIEELRNLCDLKYRNTFRFEDNDLSKFVQPEHRKQIETLYKTMAVYCDKFPNVKYRDILLLGGTGVGKTCLASAVANRLIDKGFSVMFVTAFDFNRLMLRYHTSPEAERAQYLDGLIGCDFLILDDLGTEQKLRNVTEEYLFMVINIRNSNGKHTMYSTNLQPEELLDFYGERIFSRMADVNNTLIRRVTGTDLRTNYSGK